jgi:valyl-tRNA synthetase
MEALTAVVVAARKLRAEQNVPLAQRVSLSVASGSEQTRSILAENEEVILLLARGADLHLSDDTDARPAVAELIHCHGEPAVVSMERAVSRRELEQHRTRLERELSHLQREDAKLRAKLENVEFCHRAPAEIVEKARARHDDLEQTRARLEARLADVARSLEQ